ncbi:MAG: hypothetical protein IJ325_10605 [Clostridia bacterium]|nr:hypothetical protein [Clostridia bacterium]
MEFFVLFAGVALVILLVIGIRSCSSGSAVPDGVLDDASLSEQNPPGATVLTVIPTETVSFPFSLSQGIVLEQFYTSTGYFPEDGTEEDIENVLAVKLTNTSDKTLEYLTFTLNVNDINFKFAATTIPAGKSVYVFNTERFAAPGSIISLESAVEYEIYFNEEPSTLPDILSCEIQNGSIVVKNISEYDISSDIFIYYKVTADGGYLGGITYRLRVSGGLDAGETYNAYAPHAFIDKTEIMFAHYEE